jgi:hypothetical protein
MSGRFGKSCALLATVLVTGGAMASLAAPAGAVSPPPAPTVTIVQANTNVFARIKVGFTGDGDSSAIFDGSCTSTAGDAGAVGYVPFPVGPVVSQFGGSVAIPGSLPGFSDVPLSAPGVSPVVYNEVTCSITETTSLGGEGPAGTATIPLTIAGPGCVPSGTVAAPAQISGAAQAFPGAVVSWSPVVTDCLQGYLITPSSGSAIYQPGPSTTRVIKGPYALGSFIGFTVAAVTAAGVGPQSAGVLITIGTPAPAAQLKASNAGKGALKVSFKAGANNGAAITSFTAKCGSRSASGKASPVVVKGLTTGKSYTCTVIATNSRGKGAPARSVAAKA